MVKMPLPTSYGTSGFEEKLDGVLPITNTTQLADVKSAEKVQRICASPKVKVPV